MKCNKCHGETVGDQLQCDGCFMEDHSYPVAPGLCPDPLPDDIQDELTQLRARVKELEASRSLVAMDQLIRITEQNLELTARIRELEDVVGEKSHTIDELRRLSAQSNSTVSFLNQSLEWKDARIRELEEAMRRMIGEHEPGSDCVATGPLTGTAMDYVCVFCTGKKILSDEKGRE